MRRARRTVNTVAGDAFLFSLPACDAALLAVRTQRCGTSADDDDGFIAFD
jgi:hypothetical protein